MTHSSFHIGLDFYLSGKPWRVTDLGTRTVIAIRLDDVDNHGKPMDESWFIGPPYGVLKEVIDEYDLPACSLEPDTSQEHKEMIEALAELHRKQASDTENKSA